MQALLLGWSPELVQVLLGQDLGIPVLEFGGWWASLPRWHTSDMETPGWGAWNLSWPAAPSWRLALNCLPAWIAALMRRIGALATGQSALLFHCFFPGWTAVDSLSLMYQSEGLAMLSFVELSEDWLDCACYLLPIWHQSNDFSLCTGWNMVNSIPCLEDHPT